MNHGSFLCDGALAANNLAAHPRHTNTNWDFDNENELAELFSRRDVYLVVAGDHGAYNLIFSTRLSMDVLALIRVLSQAVRITNHCLNITAPDPNLRITYARTLPEPEASIMGANKVLLTSEDHVIRSIRSDNFSVLIHGDPLMDVYYHELFDFVERHKAISLLPSGIASSRLHTR